jgi:hypothetical protein
MKGYCRRRPVAIGWLVLWSTLNLPAYGQVPFSLKLEVKTGEKRPQQAHASPSGAILVLNNMDEAGRQQLADSMAKLAAAVDKRKNPFFVSIDDSAERTVVESLIQQTTPAFTAAATLCVGRWQSAEGDLQVRPVSRCAPRTLCVSLSEASDGDAIERRSRFLAWPLGYAIVLSVKSPRQVDEVAAALRAPGSNLIALVLTSAELHLLRKSPALKQLLDHARHVAKSLPEKHSPFLDVVVKIANATSAKDELPWLKLPQGSILIVPRLGALATRGDFVSDVRARLQTQAAQIEWLATPR